MGAPSWRPFLAGAAFGALVATAFVSCARDEAPRTTTDHAARTPVAAAPTPIARRARASSGAERPTSSIRHDAEPAGDEPADEPTSPPPSDADDFPGIDVEVVGFDSRPVAQATVYALSAGRSWTDGSDEPPHAETDAAGRARLSVLRAGRYDVGACWGALRVMAADVDMPAGEPLQLRLPEGVLVAAVVERPLFEDETTPHWRFFIGGPLASVLSYPGRADPPTWSTQGILQTTEDLLSFVVPRGARCTFRAPMDDFVVRPAELTAPGEFRLVADSRLTANLRFEFEPADGTFGHPYQLRVEVAAGEARREWTLEFDSGQRARMEGTAFPMRVPAAAGEIRWSGDGVLSGSTTYAGLGKTGDNVVPLPIRLARDAPWPPAEEPRGPDPPMRRRRLRVAAGGGDPDAELTRMLVNPDGDWAGGERDDEVLGMDDARWAMARRGDWFAGPVDIGADEHGDVELTLQRGGYLIVVPDRRLPPESLGLLTLARKDGLPCLFEHGQECAVRMPLATALVVGPLPAGPIEFEVRVGDEVVGAATGTVRVGGFEPLRIPRIGGR